MLLNLLALKQKYNLDITGVVHVGAHHGEELEIYQQLQIKNIMCFEPVKSTFNELKKNLRQNVTLHNVALGNLVGEMTMYTETSNRGQSNSLLEPGLHTIQYPFIKFDGRETVQVTKLDAFIENAKNFNFLNVDVQGYELEVFKGGSEFLKSVKYIITEVNNAEVYKGCAKVDELDEFLGQNYNFKRVETYWAGGTWGDAFYVKS